MTYEIATAVETARGMLRGIRHIPENDRGWTAVLLQGYFSSTHVGPARLYVQIGRELARRGVEVWRMDPYGVGDSDGDFEDATYAGHLADHAAVLAQVVGRRRMLVGHSLGATFAVRLAAREPVDRLLLVSPACGKPSSPDGPISREDRVALARDGRVERKGTPITQDYVATMESEDIYGVARAVTCEYRMLVAAQDEWFDHDSSARLLGALGGPGRMIGVERADHNFLRPGARARFLRRLAIELGRLAW